MTVSTTVSSVSYTANGTQTTFPYTFKIFEDSDLLVILRNSTTGVEATQTLTTDYTVTNAGNDAGGNVVFGTAPSSDNTVFIRRVLDATQTTDYVENDPFPAESHEDALDKLTMLVQQNALDENRAIIFPESDVGAGLNNVLPSSVTRANKVLGFDNSGAVDLTDSTITQIDAAVSSFVNATGNNATSILYDPAGTGAQQRTVENKLRDVVSVKDFGAIGNGTSDDSAAVKAAMQYASSIEAMLYWPAGTYVISSGVNGLTDSITTLYMSMYGVTVKFDSSGGSFNWLENIDDLYIEGGVIGQTGFGLSGGMTIRWSTGGAYSMVQLRDVQFQTGGDQSRCIFSDTGVDITVIDIQNCEFRNFKRGAIECRTDQLSSSEHRILISGCYFKNMGNSDGLPCSAIFLGRNDAQVESVHITNCTFRNIAVTGTTGPTDVHAILVYGESAVIDGNHIEFIKNDDDDDAEAIYVKCAYARIVNNFIRNGGTSHDGVITVKGLSFDGERQFSDYVIVANNIIEFDDNDYNAPGIGVQRNNCVISNNVLKDLRSARDSDVYSVAMGLGTSGRVSNVVVNGNTSIGFGSFMGNDEANADVTDNITITDKRRCQDHQQFNDLYSVRQ